MMLLTEEAAAGVITIMTAGRICLLQPTRVKMICSIIARMETFGKITSGPVVNDGGWDTQCRWFDFDNDGYLIFNSNYPG